MYLHNKNSLKIKLPAIPQIIVVVGSGIEPLRCENHLAPLPAVSQHPYPQIIINVKP